MIRRCQKCGKILDSYDPDICLDCTYPRHNKLRSFLRETGLYIVEIIVDLFLTVCALSYFFSFAFQIANPESYVLGKMMSNLLAIVVLIIIFAICIRYLRRNIYTFNKKTLISLIFVVASLVCFYFVGVKPIIHRYPINFRSIRTQIIANEINENSSFDFEFLEKIDIDEEYGYKTLDITHPYVLSTVRYYGDETIHPIDLNGNSLLGKEPIFILYDASPYPDLTSSKRYVSKISWSTGDNHVYGLTLDSTFEEFKSKLEEYNYEVTFDENGVVGTKGNVSISFVYNRDGGKRITVEVVKFFDCFNINKKMEEYK